MFYKVMFHDTPRKYKFYANNYEELCSFIARMKNLPKCYYIVIPLTK